MSANILKGRALTVFNEMTRAGVTEQVALQEVRRQGLEGVPAERLTETQTAVRDALTAPARAIYESWRSVGHSHVQALEEVRAALVDAAPVVAVDESAFDRRSAAVFGRAPVQRSTVEESDAVSARVFGRPVQK